MKTKELKELYKNSKKDNIYVTEKDFIDGCKLMEKCFKNYNARKYKSANRIIYVGMYVSRSGMLRRFNFEPHAFNLVANVIYNNKASYDEVKVGGCGMDMLWHTLFRCMQAIAGRDYANDNYNGTASSITKIL